jgi:acyl-homoserine lactone acylase PvdQ
LCRSDNCTLRYQEGFTAPGFSLSNDWDEISTGYRAERITNLIEQGSGKGILDVKLGVPAMQAMQLDVISYVFRDFKPVLAAMDSATLSVQASEWRSLLLGWDGDMKVGSREASVFNRWMLELETLPSQVSTSHLEM